MSKWFEEIPYGPLTKPDYDRLGWALHLDVPDAEMAREVAQQRGVDKTEFAVNILGDTADQLIKDFGGDPNDDFW